jgi:hypothetical protein
MTIEVIKETIFFSETAGVKMESPVILYIISGGINPLVMLQHTRKL